MRQVILLLMVVAFLIACPVLIPIAFVLHARDQRRMRAAADRARCGRCGAILGAASMHRANTVWAERVAALYRDRPGIRLRLVRRLWALCAACGAEYDFDATLRIFSRLPDLAE
jgi:hypothetical protein